MILFFGSKFCKPCESLKKLLDSNQIRYTYIDKDEEEMIRRYDIQSLPTLILIKNGIPYDSVVGFNNNKILKIIEIWGKDEDS